MANNASDQQQDFQLRPLPNTPPQPETPRSPRPDAQTIMSAPANPPAEFPHSLSSNDAVIAGGILLLLAIVFFFVRGGVRRHLIAERASLSAAGNAGWAVFAFLLTLAATVVLGVFGNLWQILIFTIPMGALVLVTLILSFVLYSAAARGRR